MRRLGLNDAYLMVESCNGAFYVMWAKEQPYRVQPDTHWMWYSFSDVYPPERMEGFRPSWWMAVYRFHFRLRDHREVTAIKICYWLPSAISLVILSSAARKVARFTVNLRRQGFEITPD